MRKAYDTILSDYVDAESAARNGGFEPYRYECACCWEEVRLCAVDSRNQVAHFRHRSGNNNVECENYLGSRNEIIHNGLSHRNVRNKIEFYFSNMTKMFSISVKFSAEEISVYEKSGANFQLRNKPWAEPAISIPINSRRFIPDVPELIPITEFSWEYYVSITNNPKEMKVFRKDSRGNLYPSFFKIQADSDEDSFQAKLVRSETLYTNTPYLIVFTHPYYFLSFQNDVKVEQVFKFRTMERDFVGVVIRFTNNTAEIEQKLKEWKYKLEANETLTLLWPPSFQINESFFIKSKFSYIFSSFEMQAHGNINVHSEDIVRLRNGISRILINERTKVYRKNAELVLDKFEDITDEHDTLSVTQEESKNYVALDNGAYLFNRSGVSQLSKGVSVFLTMGSEVRHYSFGYLDRIVRCPNNIKVLVGERLLHDILIHYKRTEAFNWRDYESFNLNLIVFQYIKSCEQTGRINSAVKRFIEEGCM